MNLPHEEERRSVSEPWGGQASAIPYCPVLPARSSDTSAGSSSSSSSSRPPGPGIGACGLGKLAKGIPGEGPGGVRLGVALKAIGSAILRTWDEGELQRRRLPGWPGRVGTLGGPPFGRSASTSCHCQSSASVPHAPHPGPPTRGVFPPFSSPQSRQSTSLANGRQPGVGRTRLRSGGGAELVPPPLRRYWLEALPSHPIGREGVRCSAGGKSLSADWSVCNGGGAGVFKIPASAVAKQPGFD